MICPSLKCQSSNVQLLSHYRKSLPKDSELRATYAPPPAAGGGVMPGLGVVALGILILVSGYLIGLLAIAAGGLWVYGAAKLDEEAQRKRDIWENSRICLVCTEKWTP